MVEEEDTFVVVLIGMFGLLHSHLKRLIFPLLADEVESLTAARAGAMAGTEPSDGLRVSASVYCRRILLLTQLDKLKHRKNVLVVSTSNLVKAIGAIKTNHYSYPTIDSRRALP
jgi:hypothetical protein